jgi:hypothetical protein
MSSAPLLPQQVPRVAVGGRRERWVVGGVATVEAAVWGWAALILPWEHGTLFSALAALTAASNVATAATALCAPRVFHRCWRVSSWIAFALLVWLSWLAWSSGFYLSGLYGELGEGLFALLVAGWGLAVLTLLPLATWGLLSTPPFRTRVRSPGALTGLVLFSCVTGGWATSPRPSRASELPTHFTEDFEQLGALLARAPLPPERPRLLPQRAARCKRDPAHVPTLLLGYTQRQGDAKSWCAQADTSRELWTVVTRRLGEDAARGPVVADVVLAVDPLEEAPWWLVPLSLRPGLDGVCLNGRCFAPWQLLAQGAFVDRAPLSFFPELKFGFSAETLRRGLKGEATQDPLSGMQRIRTRSFVVSAGGTATELRRMQAVGGPVERAKVLRAATLFERHILDAQLQNGRFRYKLNPFSGRADRETFDLARHAGTTYALCDVGGETDELRVAVQRALKALAKFARPVDGMGTGLAMPNDELIGLGPSALGLVAFLQCRPRVGTEFDSLIVGLSQFVLGMATPDGDFASAWNPGLHQRILRPSQLYAQGQAVLALVLLERAQIAEATALQPNNVSLVGVALQVDEAGLGATLERAMRFVALRYWNHAMYPFFFIEENWHCIAAREALTHRRVPEYEQFCLDYATFKSRLILDETSRVDPELWGAFGLGNVIPPHTAGAAGFGEALAAALAVERARDEHALRDTAPLREIVGLLARQQWNDENAFACVPEAIGALSEQVHSPMTRIDFSQHAWAALVHAERELTW